MKKIFIVLSSLVIVGCAGDVKDSLGLRKPSPDEFHVISNPPLYVPPEFVLSKPQVPENREFDSSFKPDPKKELLTSKEKAFFNWLVDEKPDSEVKKMIDDEIAIKEKERKKKGVIRKAVEKINAKEESIIDPVKEKERIKVNVEEDKPINEGDVQTKPSKSTISKVIGK